MNISRGVSDYFYLESRYYKIFVDRCFSDALEAFAAAADERLERMEHFLGGEPASLEHKAFYFIKCAEKDGESFGRAFADDRIVCFFDGEQDPCRHLLPFVHEEAHLLTAKLFGLLPSFWNEGIAERLAVFLNAERWDEDRLKILDLNIALSSEMMPTLWDMSWTVDDTLYQKYRRRFVTGYVFAAFAVDYIINTYGKEKFFSYMRGFAQQKDAFCDFLRREKVFPALLESGKQLILRKNG